MNWYSTLKHAMPLPSVQNNYPNPHEGWGGILAVDEQLPQEAADEINQTHGDLSYLGHGANGIAFTHKNPNSVIKLTKSRQEAERAFQLRSHNIPCVVSIFDVQQVANSVWKIETEKVQPLTPEDRSYIKWVGLLGKDKSDERIERTILSPEEKANLSRYVKEYTSFLACLESNGVPSADVKRDNMGRNSKGHFVLLDVG